MGYISNANGLRLHITKGWYHKIISNKFITDNRNIIDIIKVKDYSLRYFETRKSSLDEFDVTITNTAKAMVTRDSFNLYGPFLNFVDLTDDSIDYQFDYLESLNEPVKNKDELTDIKIYAINLYKDLFSKRDFSFKNQNFNGTVRKLINDSAVDFSNNFIFNEELLSNVNPFRPLILTNDLIDSFQDAFDDYADGIAEINFKVLNKYKSVGMQKLFHNNKKQAKLSNIKGFNFFEKPKGYHQINSKFVTDYYIKKLEKKYTLNHVSYPLKKELERVDFIKGLKIRTRGRFTKTQRASYKNLRTGGVSLNSFSQPVNYDFKSIPLKYGVGSVKIWLNNQVNINKQISNFFKK